LIEELSVERKSDCPKQCAPFSSMPPESPRWPLAGIADMGKAGQWKASRLLVDSTCGPSLDPQGDAISHGRGEGRSKSLQGLAANRQRAIPHCRAILRVAVVTGDAQ
jgi:hypothetical protein